MSSIRSISGIEILDSRGHPTVRAYCVLQSGARGVASVPAGASTGGAEAVERRDRDAGRYGGLGCLNAAKSIEEELGPSLIERDLVTQADLDGALLECDGTPDKRRLGANTLLACSLAFARARAVELERPLYEYLADLAGTTPRLPRLTINLFSGGRHAGGQVAVQDVLIAPLSADSIDGSLVAASAVYRQAAGIVKDKYKQRPLTADEGGLAPDFGLSERMMLDATDAIIGAGLVPGTDVALAVDVAASQFHSDRGYDLDGSHIGSEELIDVLSDWVDRFRLLSVEDGLAEDDWANWVTLCSRLSDRTHVLGDDLLCTNPTRVQRAIESHAATALLLKPNQIGTLTEALRAMHMAREAGWSVVISARSGETEDDWLADLAVGWASDFIKVGSITRSERLSKYNRLLEIEALARLPMAAVAMP